MIAMTTSNSMSVNPFRILNIPFCPTWALSTQRRELDPCRKAYAWVVPHLWRRHGGAPARGAREGADTIVSRAHLAAAMGGGVYGR